MRPHTPTILVVALTLLIMWEPESGAAQDRSALSAERDRMLELIGGGASATTIRDAWNRVQIDGKPLRRIEAASLAAEILQRGPTSLVRGSTDGVAKAMAELDRAESQLPTAQLMDASAALRSIVGRAAEVSRVLGPG